MKRDKLSAYKKKRDFSKTSEPKNGKIKKYDKPIFVVQKHASSRLHYDLRLECNGVLKSWAIPKGLSNDPKTRHLAIQTEDHPYSYADFEGDIPKGEYGAGNVKIWDKGTYRSLKSSNSIEDDINKGEVAVWFSGKKLKGGYALIRTHYGNKDNSWILVKMKDEYAKESYSD